MHFAQGVSQNINSKPDTTVCRLRSRSFAHKGGTRVKTVPAIDYKDAKEILDAIVSKALQLRKAAVVAVTDAHGELIAFGRMDGAPIASIRIAANKAWTAARDRKPTKDIGDKIRDPMKGFDIAYYGDPRFVGWGGGLPIWKDGEVVGAIGVSGLSSTEDIELATLGLDWVAGRELHKSRSSPRSIQHKDVQPRFEMSRKLQCACL